MTARRFGVVPAAAFLVVACGSAANPTPARAPGGRPPARATEARPTIPTAVLPGVATSTSGAPANVPRPVASATALPPIGAPWGTADPITFVAAGPDCRWLVACQARHDTNRDGAVRVDVGAQGELRGDALDGFFLDAPGPGFRIDAFVGSDPSGRFVAFVRDGQLVLRDTATSVDTLLGPDADLRDDLGTFVHPRAVAFDPTGKRLLYLRRAGSVVSIVVRELATGAEIAVDPADGNLWRADFDSSGDWVVARVVAADTNHDGHLDWTVREAPKPWMRCTGPLPRYAVWERPGDDAEIRVARATGGSAVTAPGLVVPFGDTFIERDPDGSLVRVDSSGSRTVIAAKACESRLLHVDAARALALITCLDKKSRPQVLLVAKSGVKPLGIALTVAVGDHFVDGAPRLVPLQPGAGAVLVDLDHQDVEALTDGDRILSTFGTRALVLRAHSVVFHERGSPERTLPGEVTPLAHVLRGGSTLFVPPYVVDLEKGEPIGRSNAPGLAVSKDGAILVAERPADATHLAVGPLHWAAPDPIPAH